MTRPTFENFDRTWAEQVVGRVAPSGLAGYLGLRITMAQPGRVVCEMPVTDQLLTGFGTLHGGCLSALCDHIQGVVMYPVMEPGGRAATTEFKVNLLAPVTGGRCVATAEIVAMSTHLAVVRTEVVNGNRLVAVAQGTSTITPAGPTPRAH